MIDDPSMMELLYVFCMGVPFHPWLVHCETLEKYEWEKEWKRLDTTASAKFKVWSAHAADLTQHSSSDTLKCGTDFVNEFPGPFGRINFVTVILSGAMPEVAAVKCYA